MSLSFDLQCLCEILSLLSKIVIVGQGETPIYIDIFRIMLYQYEIHNNFTSRDGGLMIIDMHVSSDRGVTHRSITM